jgi:hypothetical protein
VLFGKEFAEWNAELTAGKTVKLRELIGLTTTQAKSDSPGVISKMFDELFE